MDLQVSLIQLQSLDIGAFQVIHSSGHTYNVGILLRVPCLSDGLVMVCNNGDSFSCMLLTFSSNPPFILFYPDFKCISGMSALPSNKSDIITSMLTCLHQLPVREFRGAVFCVPRLPWQRN